MVRKPRPRGSKARPSSSTRQALRGLPKARPHPSGPKHLACGLTVTGPSGPLQHGAGSSHLRPSRRATPKSPQAIPGRRVPARGHRISRARAILSVMASLARMTRRRRPGRARVLRPLRGIGQLPRQEILATLATLAILAVLAGRGIRGIQGIQETQETQEIPATLATLEILVALLPRRASLPLVKRRTRCAEVQRVSKSCLLRRVLTFLGPQPIIPILSRRQPSLSPHAPERGVSLMAQEIQDSQGILAIPETLAIPEILEIRVIQATPETPEVPHLTPMCRRREAQPTPSAGALPALTKRRRLGPPFPIFLRSPLVRHSPRRQLSRHTHLPSRRPARLQALATRYAAAWTVFPTPPHALGRGHEATAGAEAASQTSLRNSPPGRACRGQAPPHVVACRAFQEGSLASPPAVAEETRIRPGASLRMIGRPRGRGFPLTRPRRSSPARQARRTVPAGG